ncbi:hypothetical protein MUG78_17345 [Gordonia alkaliphila]|uniref:hypothetical protein n=1 Tax=Gordonia alkaliphila TaxID=1053547 RepID=UPI001FF56EFA|nr:hypothetical protein [Gordonia alkaliphila]MCK0441167.1 hypothetical protein [Gordonia alkaliphila]
MSTPTTIDQDDFWNKSQVLSRGWTESGITRFLGAPDAVRRNPRRRKGPKIQLFCKDRVALAEGSAQWQEWKAKSQERSDRAVARAAKAREETLTAAQEALSTLELTDDYRGLTSTQIKARASASFLAIEQRRQERSRGRYVAEQITSRRTDAFFDRIMVNWLRHEGTRYDNSLDDYFNLVGVDVAKDMIRERAYILIAEEYPFLATECHRQLEHRRRGTLRRTGKDVTNRSPQSR